MELVIAMSFTCNFSRRIIFRPSSIHDTHSRLRVATCYPYLLLATCFQPSTTPIWLKLQATFPTIFGPRFVLQNLTVLFSIITALQITQFRYYFASTNSHLSRCSITVDQLLSSFQSSQISSCRASLSLRAFATSM